jgi:hypothetical protein
LWKILEIFNKESSKDIKTLDVAKLIGIGRSKKAVKNLLHFLKSKIPDLGSNPQSTALDVSMLTITPPMQFS